MTLYYCDVTADFGDKSGADNSGNQLLGVGGLQAAIRGTGLATALAAGDTLHCRNGTGQLGRLVKMTCGKDVSGWSLADEVRNDTGDGDDWTGVVCELSVGADNTVILVELDSGKTVTNVDTADGIENTTAVDTTTLSAKACEGLQCNTNSGTDASGAIKVIGVDSSWTTGIGLSYCVTLDAQSVASNCISLGGGINGWWWENFVLENATGHGFLSAAAASGSRWTRVIFRDNGNYGLYARNQNQAMALYCLFDGNTSIGAFGPFGGLTLGCLARDNGSRGLSPRGSGLLLFCVASGNTDDNLFDDSGINRFVGCVSDGSVADGINAGATAHVLFCRITNNGDYGIRGVLNLSAIEDFNVFYNNTSGEILNIPAGTYSRTAASAAEAGYTDQAGGDFTLTLAAIMAGTDAEQIDLDWTQSPANPGYFTAGLPRIYLALVAGMARLIFLTGEVA